MPHQMDGNLEPERFVASAEGGSLVTVDGPQPGSCKLLCMARASCSVADLTLTAR